MTLKCLKFNGLTALGISSAFLAGGFVNSRLASMSSARADSNRVFELRVYHAIPGKVPALESRFRETTSAILTRHDLRVVGYWVPDDPPASANTFIFMLAHSSREEAKRNWAAMLADPAFQEMVKSERADKLVEGVDATYLHPTDFSPLK